jgi:hypothetical protein
LLSLVRLKQYPKRVFVKEARIEMSAVARGLEMQGWMQKGVAARISWSGTCAAGLNGAYTSLAVWAIRQKEKEMWAEAWVVLDEIRQQNQVARGSLSSPMWTKTEKRV